MADLIEQIREHLVEAVKLARAQGPSASGVNPHRHADEMVSDILEDVFAKGTEADRHGESRLRVRGDWVSIICHCGYVTGRYQTATTAVSALNAHIHDRRADG